jgi:hypothetical protein
MVEQGPELFAELCCTILRFVAPSSESAVINFVPFVRRDDTDDELPYLHALVSQVFQPLEQPSQSDITNAITPLMKEIGFKRGEHSSGVYYYVKEDGGTEKFSVSSKPDSKYYAPYINVLYEKERDLIAAHVEALAAKIEDPSSWLLDKYNYSTSAGKESLIAYLSDCTARVAYTPCEKNKKRVAVIATSDLGSGKSSRVSSPAGSPPTKRFRAEAELNPAEVISKATEMLLEDPESAQYFIDLSTYLHRHFPKLIATSPGDRSPPTAAAIRCVVAGQQFEQLRRFAEQYSSRASTSPAAPAPASAAASSATMS